MSLSRLLVALLLFSTACGGAAAPPQPSADNCRRGSRDFVETRRRTVWADVPCPGEETKEVTSPLLIPDATAISVSPYRAESGEAVIHLGDEGVCNLRQNVRRKEAVLINHYPQGALFRQVEGFSHCTIRDRQLWVCHSATVERDPESQRSYTQARTRCSRDPVVTVAAFRGDLLVTLRSGGIFYVREGEELRAFPVPTVSPAQFSQEERTLFSLQATLLDVGRG